MAGLRSRRKKKKGTPEASMVHHSMYDPHHVNWRTNDQKSGVCSPVPSHDRVGMQNCGEPSSQAVQEISRRIQ